MSLQSLSATLPLRHNFNFIHSHKQYSPLIFPEETHPIQFEKALPLTPSSSSDYNQEEEEDVRSWPDEVFSPHTPATIYSSVETSSAGTPAMKSPLTSLVEPQTACFTAFKKFNPLTLHQTKPKTKKKFTPEFYKRIEDYLDDLGLNFTMPSEHKDSSVDKSSIRKFLLGKMASENVPDTQETSIGTESSEVGSPSLKSNIGTSALILRRSSLSHTSPTELEAARQAMIVKKSIFHTIKIDDEIFEENESPYLSRQCSALLAAQKSPLKLSAMIKENKWEDVFPDVQSALSRTSSLYGNCLQIKSPAKISPMIKSGSFGRLPPINLFNSQADLRSSAAKSVLDLSTKHLKYSQDMESSTKKNPPEIASFAEMLSMSSENSFCESPDKDNEEH